MNVTIVDYGVGNLRRGVERVAPEGTGADDGGPDGGSVDDEYAYFVHSYASAVSEHTVAACDYGGEFAAVAANEAGNVMGTQFHPEKSGETGLRILQNFVDYARAFHGDRVRVAAP